MQVQSSKYLGRYLWPSHTTSRLLYGKEQPGHEQAPICDVGTCRWRISQFVLLKTIKKVCLFLLLLEIYSTFMSLGFHSPSFYVMSSDILLAGLLKFYLLSLFFQCEDREIKTDGEVSDPLAHSPDAHNA